MFSGVDAMPSAVMVCAEMSPQVIFAKGFTASGFPPGF
jgi:hypothetical protein